MGQANAVGSTSIEGNFFLFLENRYNNNTFYRYKMSLSIERKRPIVIEHSCQPSVGVFVCVHCSKTAEQIWMPFGVVSRIGPGMRHVVGFGDWSTGRGNFGGECWATHCNQWIVCGVPVRKCVNSPSCSLGWCVGLAEALVY